MNEIFIKAGQLLLSLSLLIVLHEWGHYITAKWFKCRVEKFYLFFDPWFELFKKKIGETEYGIGWLPLGGYVKISGMIDESMDKEQMAKPAEPYEFRSKPAWQRLIIMLGGVTVNLFLGIVIFAGILWMWGEQYLEPKQVKYGIAADSLGRIAGLKDGDIILSYDSIPFKNFESIANVLALNNAKTLQIIRNNAPQNIVLPAGFISNLINEKLKNFITLRIPTIIGNIEKGSIAEQAGLQLNDRIISVAGQPSSFFNELKESLLQLKNKQAEIVALKPNGDTLRYTATFNDTPKLGIGVTNLDSIFTYKTKEYSLLEALPAGASKAFSTLSNYVKNLKLLFNKDTGAYKQVGGFIAIGKMFNPTWNWFDFWQLTAILSLILAFMNVLPIPALDGGHAMFCMYEMVSGRKPSDKFLEYAQTIGMLLLFGLLLFANGNDIFNLFK